MAFWNEFGKLIIDSFSDSKEFDSMMQRHRAITDNKTESLKPAQKQESNIPIPPGTVRSSVENNISTFSPTTKLSEVKPNFAVEYLSTLENLASFNPDISYAIDNIVSLGNTPHELEFNDNVPETVQNNVRKYLREVENKWYAHSDGTRSLKGDLLAQVAINGAVSAEVVPAADLRSVLKVVRVAPKYISFVYDKVADDYSAYQNVTNIFGVRNADVYGKIKLNPITYKYIALRRYSEGPYGVPPFITAIESLVIQRPMIKNFAQIMNKLGMLGFLSSTVVAPEQKQGEEDEVYWARCLNYLDNYVYPNLKNNLSSGVVAGFKDQHEFNLEGNTMNVAGAEGLVKIVNEMIFAAVKQDPNMLGRNYSTTETFGAVILRKFMMQIGDYQSVVDEFFSLLYSMAAQLAGFNVGYIKVKSEKALITDQVKEQTAETARIANVLKKRDEGIISQEDAAHELGYEQAHDPNYVKQQPSDQLPVPPADSKKDSKAANDIKFYEKHFNKDVPEFDYTVVNCGDVDSESFDSDFGDKKTNELSGRYLNQVRKTYKAATKKIAMQVGNNFSKYTKKTPIETIQHDVYVTLLSRWEQDFVIPTVDIINDNIEKIYTYFRKDKKIFNKTSTSSNSSEIFQYKGSAVVDAIFSLQDYRTIEFMERNDTMYLGKFIVDENTKKKVYKYLSDKYIDENLPIGASPKEITKFANEFSDLLQLEAYKIRRVIDTSVSKLKNFGALRYMNQVGVETYEIVEIRDQLTCGYCEHMDGKTFSVKVAMDNMDAEINAGPENINQTSPFATKIPLDDFLKKDAAQLQNDGISKPPYHCHCRGRVVVE